jgi:hypothetical protein
LNRAAQTEKNKPMPSMSIIWTHEKNCNATYKWITTQGLNVKKKKQHRRNVQTATANTFICKNCSMRLKENVETDRRKQIETSPTSIKSTISNSDASTTSSTTEKTPKLKFHIKNIPQLPDNTPQHQENRRSHCESQSYSPFNFTDSSTRQPQSTTENDNSRDIEIVKNNRPISKQQAN